MNILGYNCQNFQQRLNLMYIQRVNEAIQAIRQGEIIIIMDDEDRENEGDLVMAGIFSTAEKINFMATEARGLICVSLTNDIAKKLDLEPMVESNSSNHETAFTISIDAASAKTGISAQERDLTIQLMCQEHTTPKDFVRPGHIFPLIAKNGGVLVRTGHTEASVDICTLAGLKPISVICEIMKADGQMARNNDLIAFAKKHNLKILYVSDVIQYRLQYEKLICLESKQETHLLDNPCQKLVFLDHQKNRHIVYAFSHNLNNPLIYFHKIKQDCEYFENPLNAHQSFMQSLQMLKDEGGYLICLSTQPHQDLKTLGIGAQILREMGIEQFRLLHNEDSQSALHNFSGISGFNLNLTQRVLPKQK